MGFLSKPSSSENIIILDISSGSVGVGLVRKLKGLTPEMVYTVRIPFFDSNAVESSSLEKMMLASLDTALAQVIKHGIPILHSRKVPTDITRMMIVFSSPWLISKLATKSIMRDAEFTLDHKLINEVFRKEGNFFKQELDARYKSDHEVFESMIIGVSAAGRNTEFPTSKKSTYADIHFSQSAASSTLVQKIENKVLGHMSIKEGVSLQSFQIVFFQVLTHSFRHLQSFALVHMSEEMTDILFINDFKPELSISLPFGTNTIARQIAQKHKMPLPIALSTLSLFSKEILDEVTTKIIDGALLDAEEVWSTLWKEAMATDKKPAEVPQAFIVATSPFEHISKTLIESILPESEGVVVGIENDFISNIMKSLRDDRDEELSIIGCFSHIEF